MTDPAHAPLPPSSAHRWVTCHASPTAEALYPETEPSPESLEGNAAHWVVEQVLQGNPPSIDSLAPNGTPVAAEMLEGADLVIDSVRKHLGHTWREFLFIEQRVHMARIHPDNWGTPDYYGWGRLPDSRLVLNLWDYKYGHDIVEVAENWQLVDYVAGILDQAQTDGLQEQNIVVNLFVVQPRSYHRDGPVRHWQVCAADLRAQWNLLRAAAEAARGPNPLATPSPGGCKNCRARHACEALQREAYKAADKGVQWLALDLSPHALGLELRALTRARAMLDARVSGLEAQAVASIKRGQLVPFWMMQSTPGRLKWNKSPQEVVMLGQMFGVDLKQPLDVLTPTQAIAAGLPEATVAPYASRPAGTAKLVADDGTKARLTFMASGA